MAKRKNPHMTAIKRSLLFSLIIFSAWLFFWPLVECWYAQSLDPLLTNDLKWVSFLMGGIIFWISDYTMFIYKWNNGLNA